METFVVKSYGQEKLHFRVVDIS